MKGLVEFGGVPVRDDQNSPPIKVRYTLSGVVQGVGFRPFVYNLAQKYQLCGWVKNESGVVIIEIQGPEPSIHRFKHQLLNHPPPASSPNLIEETLAEENIESFDGSIHTFEILDSSSTTEADIHLSVDLSICKECEQELLDESNPRYQHPFINCTQCGPRYTLIESLPYDRQSTTMKTFPLCESCLSEYTDATDRRFHAEPISCHQCGPVLCYNTVNEKYLKEQALDEAVKDLQRGKIIAIKGIGGYHWVCDATNDQAIKTLRKRKNRFFKPLAIMATEAWVDHHLSPTRFEKNALQGTSKPIVLINVSPNTSTSNQTLPDAIHPGLNRLGVMLPYTPLHILLLNQLQKPLVMTSANLSGNPIFIEDSEVLAGVGRLFDGVLNHNRDILRPCDDSVIQINHSKPQTIRPGRGISPLEITLPWHFPGKGVLALGAQSKTSIAFWTKNRLVLFPQISSAESLKSQHHLVEQIKDIQNLYQIDFDHLVIDRHPGYWANRFTLGQPHTLHKVWHHHAHASSLALEFPAIQKWLSITWDGLGLGPGDELWGGESFYGNPGQWQRTSTIEPILLTGGDSVAKESWRVAASLCWQCGKQAPEHLFEHLTVFEQSLFQQAYQKKINTFESSAVGRLLEGCAALLKLLTTQEYEGQGPMLLQSQAESILHDDCISLPWISNEESVLILDWRPLIDHLILSLTGQATPRETSYLARLIHNSLAKALVEHVLCLKSRIGSFTVGLSGGVFQNRLLVDLVSQRLEPLGIPMYINGQVPSNDSGIAVGQCLEVYAHLSMKT